MKKERLFGPDILRACAVVLVFFIHSLNYKSNVLTSDLLSVKWFLFATVKFVSLSCVPLFMMLSGFFMHKKTLKSSYYKGIVKIVLPYIIISTLSLLVRSHIYGDLFNFKSVVFSTLNYTANGYAWYVEFYICLFLLIPFLNSMYNALEKNKKLILILILAFITILPATLKKYVAFDTALDIIPNYWEALYPLVFYFSGAFIEEYKPKIKKYKVAITFFTVLILTVLLCAWLTHRDGAFAWYSMNGFASLANAFIAITLFLFFYDVDINFRPIKTVVKEVSESSFEVYLFSYITDVIVYRNCSSIYPVPVFVSFATAFVLARILRLILDPIVMRLTKKRNKTNTQ